MGAKYKNRSTTTTTKGDVPKDKPASDEAQDDVPTSQ